METFPIMLYDYEMQLTIPVCDPTDQLRLYNWPTPVGLLPSLVKGCSNVSIAPSLITQIVD